MALLFRLYTIAVQCNEINQNHFNSLQKKSIINNNCLEKFISCN